MKHIIFMLLLALTINIHSAHHPPSLKRQRDKHYFHLDEIETEEKWHGKPADDWILLWRDMATNMAHLTEGAIEIECATHRKLIQIKDATSPKCSPSIRYPILSINGEKLSAYPYDAQRFLLGRAVWKAFAPHNASVTDPHNKLAVAPLTETGTYKRSWLSASTAHTYNADTWSAFVAGNSAGAEFILEPRARKEARDNRSRCSLFPETKYQERLRVFREAQKKFEIYHSPRSGIENNGINLRPEGAQSQ